MIQWTLSLAKQEKQWWNQWRQKKEKNADIIQVNIIFGIIEQVENKIEDAKTLLAEEFKPDGELEDSTVSNGKNGIWKINEKQLFMYKYWSHTFFMNMFVTWLSRGWKAG